MKLTTRSFALILPTLALSTGALAQWTAYNTQGYSSVFSVTTGPGAIYMVSYGSGVIKSTDGGSNWNPANTGLPSVSTIESVYYNGVSLFCGTHSGVYKSTNGGTSWALSNTGLPASTPSNCVKEFYHFGGATFAIFSGQIGTGTGGVWRSTDDGTQWYSGNSGLSSNMTVHQLTGINGILYGATTSAIVTSSNLAVGWTTMPSSNFSSYGIQGTPTRLVAITSFGYRYKNLPSGSWTDSNVGDPPNPSGGTLTLYDGKYWALTGDGAVLRSTDNGVTWAGYETGLLGADVITQYCFHASGTTLFMGALSNLYGTPGTTVGEAELDASPLPLPYPTLFSDAFTVDLGEIGPGHDLVLIDASGREARREANLPVGLFRVERNALPAGTYRVQIVDRASGTRRLLGAVIAE